MNSSISPALTLCVEQMETEVVIDRNPSSLSLADFVFSHLKLLCFITHFPQKHVTLWLLMALNRSEDFGLCDSTGKTMKAVNRRDDHPQVYNV